MMKFTRITFRNMSPLHLGKGRDSYDTASSVLSSDMLSAALASVRAMKGRRNDIKDFLSSFIISSALPYCGKEYFLPRPNGRLNIVVKEREEKEYRKKLKKLRYISTPLWNEMIKGKTLEVMPSQIHGEFLISTPEDNYKSPMTRIVNQRVMVPREEGNDAVPYMFQWTFFQHGEKESGLYCLIEAGNERTEEIVNLFKVLGSLGIGSDRTVGGGLFDIEVDDFEWQQPIGNSTMLLSTYIPQESELPFLNLSSSNYSLSKLGGFMAGSANENIRHLRRKTINMFDAGSVFLTNHPLEGTIVDLAPQWNTNDMHPVYRSGRPLYVTVNLNKDEE